MHHDVTDRSARKITKGWVVYRALTGMNGETRFAMVARTAGLAPTSWLYQNRNVIPTWLG
jgi:hypothetical protein